MGLLPNTPHLTFLQYFAWVDFLSFFIFIGPSMLIFLAINSLSPEYRSNTVMFPDKSKVVVTLTLYTAERNMSVIEHGMIQRVRVGCGRHYIRTFVEHWESGRAWWVMALLTISMFIPLVSAVFFLILVPGKSFFAKAFPAIHLFLNVCSVSTTMIGNYILNSYPLCSLNYVWPPFKIQTGILLLSAAIITTYKLYEIRKMLLYCKELFASFSEGMGLDEDDESEMDIETLVAQLKKEDEKAEEKKEVVRRMSNAISLKRRTILKDSESGIGEDQSRISSMSNLIRD